jgi:hypothetical protein
MIVTTWYKLQMFGIPIDGPANVFWNNHGVLKKRKHSGVNIDEATQ